MTSKQKDIEARDERVVDVLERFAAASLYLNTSLGQTDIAKILGMGNNRVNEILKGIEKEK
ncbi:MAG TPA: hypothetical protein VN862_00900 [Candidatus Acidoferrales bacterium]|nr:hypothetical protein [Candidatus Acidoferrales bacterium]